MFVFQLYHKIVQDPNFRSFKNNPFYIIQGPVPEPEKTASISMQQTIDEIDPDSPEAEDISVPVLQLPEDRIELEGEIVKIQIQRLAEAGVTVEAYNQFYIEGAIEIGEGCRIAPGVVIKGSSEIGKGVHLYPNCYIENSRIGDQCHILPGSVIRDSIVNGNNSVGPYAHLRNGVVIEMDAKIGNFVEMKKTRFGKGSKAMHLSYVGDADVGEKVNIGAGTITCNYDGVNKNKTTIADNVFIGSGTELIAPVTIGKNAYVAAGSTITNEVPEDSLGVARGRQRNVEGWVKRKKRK